MHTFEKIEGNSVIVKSLQNAIKYNKLSHSYIFDGQKYMGKKLIATTFAKGILCLGEGCLPCGNCVSCKTFESGNNPDFITVKPQKTASLGIEDVREQIVSTVNVMPYKYRHKVYLIENADKMTVQAQNAILKTIEQPPDYGVFLLVSNNLNNLLPTILSRCVIYKIKPLSDEKVKSFLIKDGMSEEEANLCAYYSGGSIGKALKLSNDPDFKDFREQVISVVKGVETGNVVNVFSNVKKIEKFKENITEALDLIYLWYRDALVYKLTSDPSLVSQKDKIVELKGFCEGHSLENIITSADAVFDTKTSMGYNVNFQLAMEVMFMKLADI